ncbi:MULTISPECIES: hypothetical protein [Bacillaceae]|uniref:Uncharacterized protein n=1 Tax=Gottfriedia luciferensis TaxID=178774 RepID=A0ABX2ZUJ4_9BACI|nr:MULTISPECIES: hypothetical protein [Bacillaceae]ODG92335.1 hypothetical protein BED47_20375 [Gottfriedia luciferensis]PGZ93542.1 hypothetical protein COE53_06090 [Bacillus sp. AFS029533]SFC19584.1 hypothetical protein SAMN02799633_00051 [Bacillus sp. UNCCL81]
MNRFLIALLSIIGFSSSLVFPYYVLFLRNIGDAYDVFSLLYGLFSLSLSVVVYFGGRFVDRVSPFLLMIFHSLFCCLLFFSLPLIDNIKIVYIGQVLFGGFTALFKIAEKKLFMNASSDFYRSYLFWTSFVTAICIIGVGTLLESIDIQFMFHLAAWLFLISAIGLCYKLIMNKRLTGPK